MNSDVKLNPLLLTEVQTDQLIVMGNSQTPVQEKLVLWQAISKHFFPLPSHSAFSDLFSTSNLEINCPARDLTADSLRQRQVSHSSSGGFSALCPRLQGFAVLPGQAEHSSLQLTAVKLG